MSDHTIFRGKDAYEVQTKLDETSWYSSYLVRARNSGQFFNLFTTGEKFASDYSQLLQRAARILSTVESPHIVRAYDVGVHENTFFVVVDQIEGQQLGSWIDRQEAISEFVALRLLRQLALALKDLEYYNTPHGNLRHSSIIIAPDSSSKGDLLLRIWDLVLASEIEDTIAFQAPERIRGEPLDIRTDIYGAGAIAYWMLAGRPPYDTHSMAKLALLISGGMPNTPQASLQGRRQDVTDACVALVDRCLQRDPRARFQTATELVTQIEQVLGQQGDNLDFLFHQAQIAARRADWKGVLRLYERADSMRGGAKRGFRQLLQRAEKMLEEEELKHYAQTLSTIEAQRAARQSLEAETNLNTLRQRVENQRHLQPKQRERLLHELDELRENIRLQKRFRLAYLESELTQQTYPLQTPVVTVLRSENQQVNTNDTVNLMAEPDSLTVSRRGHAELRFDNGVWLVMHKPEATNLTLINGQALETKQAVVLREGDVLQFGRARVTFYLRHNGAGPSEQGDA